MRFHNRMAQLLRRCAELLEERSTVPLEEPAPAAAEQHTPSAPWQGIGERALGKSLLTLRLEAVHAVAALHLAHAAGSAIHRRRSVAALCDKAPEDLCQQLDKLHALWSRDEVQLAQALQIVGAITVPDEPLAETLELQEWETEIVDEVQLIYETTIHRQLLSEREG